MLDSKSFEKKEDNIVTIVDVVTDTRNMLGKLLGVEVNNATSSATLVDAMNQNTMASANAFINLTKSLAAQQYNQNENLLSLSESNKKSLTGVA